jgi:hypothetical protein
MIKNIIKSFLPDRAELFWTFQDLFSYTGKHSMMEIAKEGFVSNGRRCAQGSRYAQFAHC